MLELGRIDLEIRINNSTFGVDLYRCQTVYEFITHTFHLLWVDITNLGN